MAITHVASDKTSSTNWNVSNPITVTKPTGTVDDDLMIAVALRQTAGENVGPAGWTIIEESSSGVFRQGVWYKKASSEGASYDFTNAGGSGRNGCVAIATFRGVDTTTPFDVAWDKPTYYTNLTSDDTPLPDAITTVTDGAFVVIPIVWDATSTPTNAPPSGYSETGENLESGWRGTSIAYKEIASYGTETPGDFTLTGTTVGSSTFTLALRPAAAAATSPKTLTLLGVG